MAVCRYPAEVVLMRRIIRRSEEGSHQERRRRHGIAILVKQKSSTVSRYVYGSEPGASDLLSNIVGGTCAILQTEGNEGGGIILEPPVTRCTKIDMVLTIYYLSLLIQEYVQL